jgi:hypothetical protein
LSSFTARHRFRVYPWEAKATPILRKLLGKPRLRPSGKLTFDHLSAEENQAIARKIARHGKFVVEANVTMTQKDPPLDLGPMDLFYTRAGTFRDWTDPTLWAVSKHRATFLVVFTSDRGIGRLRARGYEFRLTDALWGNLPLPLEQLEGKSWSGALLANLGLDLKE